MQENILFKSSMYYESLPQFLDIVNETSKNPVYNIPKTNEEEKLNEMGVNISEDINISEFSNYVIQQAWEVLNGQGYNMDLYETCYQAMWVQTHHKGSHMPQHTHAHGCQIVAFYFLEVPDNSCKLMLHEINLAKVQTRLIERNENLLTDASPLAIFSPQPGDLIFTNAWLPHSFTSNNSDQDFKFVHINIKTEQVKQKSYEGPVIV